jgi:Bacterial Ig-like domain (group 3)
MGTASTAEWVPSAFAVGSHSISASYSGDASFNACSSPSLLNFTVTKANPYPQLSAYPSYITPSQSVTLEVVFGAGSGSAPTGTATFYSGTTALGTATVAPTTTFCWPFVCSTATLNATNLPVGTDSITAQYSGDANYEAATSSAVQVTVAGSRQPIPAVTASPNGTSMLPTQDLIVTANVAGLGGQPAPTGSISFYAYGPGGSVSGPSCSLVNASCSYDFSGGYWSPGTVTVQVSYSGDSTYATSGTTVSVTMLNMFTITAASSVSFAAGATAGNTAALTITPMNGFTGPVYFACTIAYYPPGAKHLPTCSVPTSVGVTSTAAVNTAMTISSTGPTTVSQAEASKSPRWLAAQSVTFFVGILVLGLPMRKRVRLQGRALLLMIVIVGSMALVSCGGGGSGGGGGGGSHTVPGTTAGMYRFMVAGAYTPNTRTPEPLFYSTPQVFVVNVSIQ